MKCQEFEPIVISLARGQLVEAASRKTALNHLDLCARCAIAFEEQRALTAGIRVAAESLANQGASARVEEALLQAFRERAMQFTAPEVRLRWRRWTFGLAAAAILLLALLAGMDWLKSPPASQKRETVKLPAAPSGEGPGQKQNLQAQIEWRRDQKQKMGRKSAGSRRLSERRGVRQSVESANEIATRFYPLVEEGEMPPLESGLIVRGEAPASALITLGLPITAENINRPVKVDLLLGQDGLARAIRFVP
jgi:hypothetical protein